jgi:benzoyl-CoA reductase/2-hydroxyglutaryl-CoA dehydratase subunit BcrC/BadD/HgdB
MMRRIGITTTIPVEVIYAAGCVPVDLNNVFITAPDAAARVTEAEFEGFPRGACGWIKGIYSTVLRGSVDAVIAVVEGDCSQTQAMAEALTVENVEIIPFSFPHDRDRELLRFHIEKLMARLGATWEDTLAWKRRLDVIRAKVRRLDELSWTRGALSSFENHYYQICCSDFNSDPEAFSAELDSAIAKAESAPERTDFIRLVYAGVPPIFTDLYECIESFGARVVFNEVQRQFSMPFETDDLIEQYALYTYPYDVFGRIADIEREIKRRSIRGLVHYTQSFCFRQIEDMIIRKKLDVPVLTIEGEFPTTLDARTKVRLQGFVEMLS